MAFRKQWQRDVIAWLWIVITPLVFLYVMHLIKGWVGTPTPFIHMLFNPVMLAMSAIFANAGALMAKNMLWVTDRKEDRRITYFAFVMTLLLLLPAVVYLLLR